LTNPTFTDEALLNLVQKDFPLNNHPFSTIAEQLGTTEQDVLQRLHALEQRGAISRFGAVFRPFAVGVSTLAALAVPDDRISETAELVNDTPGVNHNYQREHEYNLWFVITERNRDKLNQRLRGIADRTGFPLIDLPMEQSYHIDLGFSL
jgi:DNA-binding Lrp family transcriptional regulator|tara:strand:+ start:788 stop:1237 length:450 start_codon:yes stop_codon:yes gene_type:complete